MSNRTRYKRYLTEGDSYIPKRTLYRYGLNISRTSPIQKMNSPSPSPAAVLDQEIKNVNNKFDFENVEANEETATNDQGIHLRSPSPAAVLDQEIKNADNEFYLKNVQANGQTPMNDQMTTVDFKDDFHYHLSQILLQETLNDSSRSSKTFENIKDIMNDPAFHKPISVNPNKSRAEVLLMTLKYCIANNISDRGMKNLFKLIDNIFGDPMLPNIRHFIDKFLNSMDEVEIHVVCCCCSAYIGEFGKIEHIDKCSICTTKFDLENPNNTSYFVLLDPSAQISDIITLHQDYYEYVVKERVHIKNFLQDVYDGKAYRKFVKSLSENDRFNYISAVFNTNAECKLKSSQHSIWPLYLMLNELPRQQRLNNLIVCGLWLHKQKPDMSIFLSTFVDMMHRLTKRGISCTLRGEERALKLYILSCCVDSVTRARIQGMKQPKKRFGCNWCLHPGTCVEDEVKYTLLDYSVEPRTHDSTINIMLKATPENPIDGIKYPSPFINLFSFNIISGFVPNYIECCLEGVAKQLTEYHVARMKNEDIAEIDMLINNITAPHQISRLSQSISNRNNWSAREWENYVLYYSPVILSKYLSKKHWNHWLLFVESLYIILKENIDITELDLADQMLHEFVSNTEMYYGEKAMTHNIHQLIHLCRSVLNWGPLWCQSAFAFKAGNHDLLKQIKSSKDVTSQLIRYIKLHHIVKVLTERSYEKICEVVRIYCDDILDKLSVQNFCKISNVTYFEEGHNVDDLILANSELSKNAKIYFNAIINGCLYESSSNINKKSNNSFIVLKDGRFAKINKFIVDEENREELTICNMIHTRNCFAHHYQMLKRINEIEVNPIHIHTRDIKSICIFMKILENMYIIPIPNLLHY